MLIESVPRISRLILAALSVMTLAASAQALSPGEYITARGWGTLIIKPNKGGALSFTLEAMGANGHSCSLEGEIRDQIATLEALEKEKSCRVRFTPTAEGIKVTEASQGGECRYYCGARAGFQDDYLKVLASCASSAIARDRRAFQQFYGKKDFAAARDKLAPLLRQCGKTLYLWDEYRIRNDLAVTYHHLNNAADCRAVLEPLKDIAAMTDKEIDEGYPPSDAEMMRDVAKAARTNLKLCGIGPKGKG